MKHKARNKKNAIKIILRDLLESVLPIQNLAPHPPCKPPFLRKSGQPLNQTNPKTLNATHQRKRKAGASALFNKISTLQPLPIFFFSKHFPIILTIEYILKNQTVVSFRWRRVGSTCV